MKRVVVILLLALLLVSFANAQIGGLEGLEEGIEKIEDLEEKIPSDEEEAKQVTKDYLRQEWDKILRNNTYIGPVIKQYEKISPVTNPLFLYTVGMTPSLSWLFTLTLVIWITILIYFYRVLDLYGFFSKEISFVISVISLIIASLLGLIRIIAEFVIGVISVLTNPIVQVIVAFLIIIGLFVASYFSKQVEAYFKKVKENRAKMKQALNRRILQSDVETYKPIRDALSKVGRKK